MFIEGIEEVNELEQFERVLWVLKDSQDLKK